MEGQRCSRSLATVLTLFLAIAGSLGGVPPAASATPAQTGTPRLQTGFGSLPLTFEPNRGQAGSEVRFLARTAGSLVFLTATSIMLETAAGTGKLGRASLRFVGANSHAAVAGIHRLPGRVNYFLGNNPSRWMTDIPTYAGIKELGVYRGIDAVFHGAGATGLEYRWILHPGARVSSIRLRLRSDLQAHLSASGDLRIGSGRVTVVQQRPFAFQDAGHARITIPASYTRLPGHVIGLRLGRYDHAFPLVIDPTLIYSTYLGGFDSDGASDIAVDANGSAYITGDTLSTGFPVSHALHGSNTSQPICRLDGSQACADAFVAKLSPAGTALIYSTYLGGTLDDYGHAIA
ncbi:MAG TPA: SBBP repeat-containing protein, partial [Chloroflexota bacterium]